MEIKPYAIVAIPLPLRGLYHYKIKDEDMGRDLTGYRVKVTFGHKKKIGFVVGMDISCNIPEQKVLQIEKVLDNKKVLDDDVLQLAEWISQNYFCSIGEALLSCVPSWTILPERKVKTRKTKKEEWNPIATSVQLNEEQYAAFKSITDSIGKSYTEFLLYGVTGSGKTEVAMRSVGFALENGFSSIILVPEISLTPQMVGWFRSRFERNVAVLHSHLTCAERRLEWERIVKGDAKIVVGARSAIFAPVQNLRVIIVDEEQENSYKQDDIPRYNARDVARRRAIQHGAVLILCSATPSLETFYRASRGQIQNLTLSHRVESRPLPAIDIVDMKKEIVKGNRSPVLSDYLILRMEETLDKRQQVVLFLNRRGHSTYLFCRKCGCVIKCKRCNVSLIFHSTEKKLICHYCNFNMKAPRICPECKMDYLQFQGVGTQRVEKEVARVFQDIRVERMDTDITKTKGIHSRILGEFAKCNIDVLIGTQMIAKGLDFPNVTLVGIISADTALNFADFRSSEKTFHLLTQVSGRAGRGIIPGRVVIQTYHPQHYVIRDIKIHSYKDFYSREIESRKELFLPPFSKLLQIISKANKEQKAKDAADTVCYELQTFLRKTGASVVGPAPMPLSFLKSKYRWTVTVRIPEELWESAKTGIWECIKRCEHSTKMRFFIDVDPVSVL